MWLRTKRSIGQIRAFFWEFSLDNEETEGGTSETARAPEGSRKRKRHVSENVQESDIGYGGKRKEQVHRSSRHQESKAMACLLSQGLSPVCGPSHSQGHLLSCFLMCYAQLYNLRQKH